MINMLLFLRCPPGVLSIALWVIISLSSPLLAKEGAAPLPDGVRAVWDLEKAYRETTPTRQQICLNGLWRWQPADAKAAAVPANGWGHFKVPGSWPGITDYMQKDSQRLYRHPDWETVKLGGIQAAWYERTLTVPAGWAGRRILLKPEYLNSYATVFVDGEAIGEIHFPGGEIDLTAVCRPGTDHRLSLLVVALPLKGVMLSYSDSASAREVKGSVARRGLCGDVFLVGEPPGPRISEVRVDTSVRQGRLTLDVAVRGLEPERGHRIRARILKDESEVRSFISPHFQAEDLQAGRFEWGESWLPDRRWDLNTPENIFDLEVSLIDDDGEALDTDWTRRFGFREFWIEGRDFYLNGTRLFLSAVPLDNAQVGAALANYAAARESLERLKSFGINYVYTHNYGCEPGAHLGFAEILRAADDVGMLVGFTQPHFSHYDWKAAGADEVNGYARHAEFYADATGNHPSVVMYVMSHNATGYSEDMNPDMIDGRQDSRDQWASRNAALALRAEAIVKKLDPRRIIYHHASGNLGVMHSSNFYPNFAPVQELDDWFGHWATTGVKPAFTCEYGAPFTWDWTMYRGWYQGKREFGSARVPWEFCLAEWNAQFLGDRAYQISDAEKENLRWEARQFRDGRVWHRWDYPSPVGSNRFEERYPVFARYVTSNWRAYRTWGLSGISPWEYGHFWKPRPGVDRSRKEFPVDWERLQRPGFSPDYVDQRYERMDLAFERADWIATPAAQALLRNNRPLLAYLGGKPGAFTSKDHNFLPGETLEKQIIVINNSRAPVTCEASWSFDLPQPVMGSRRVTIAPGDQARIPVRFDLPEPLPPGPYEIHLTARFDSGEIQEDRFRIDVLETDRATFSSGAVPEVALFDPQGETGPWLETKGVKVRSISANAALSDQDILIIGKGALTVEGATPDLRRVREGLRVILFEQTPAVLEKRLGFRVTEYGLRQLFPRIPDHPILSGIQTEHLRDWRGAATILSPQLTYETRPRYGPTVEWAGLPVPRVWRCGNRGNVASVLIEKPARGDFLPVLDGGFGLQYSPLMEFREGRGVVLFCQLDVTGRTESDPAAGILMENMLRYVEGWKPAPRRRAVYAGESDGRSCLESLGVPVRSYEGGPLSKDAVLIAGPGSGSVLAKAAGDVAEFLKSGGNLLALGLDQEDVPFLPSQRVSLQPGEHIAAYFDAPGMDSVFAGIGPADVHNRDPRVLSRITSGAEILGEGVLARSTSSHVATFSCPPGTLRTAGNRT